MGRADRLVNRMKGTLIQLWHREVENGTLDYPDAEAVQEIIDDTYLMDLAQLILDHEGWK